MSGLALQPRLTLPLSLSGLALQPRLTLPLSLSGLALQPRLTLPLSLSGLAPQPRLTLPLHLSGPALQPRLTLNVNPSHFVVMIVPFSTSLEHYYDQFRNLTQGSSSVADYIYKFEQLSSRLPNINDSVLKLEFRLKLSPALRTKMLNFGEASSLKDEQEFAIKAEKLLSEEDKLRHIGNSRFRHSNSSTVAKSLPTSRKHSSGRNPAQEAKRAELRTAFLALNEAGRRAEIAKRRNEGRCTYDGLSDHTRETCPFLSASAKN